MSSSWRVNSVRAARHCSWPEHSQRLSSTQLRSPQPPEQAPLPLQWQSPPSPVPSVRGRPRPPRPQAPRPLRLLWGCGGVVRCRQDPHCVQCIDAINSTAGFPHTHHGHRAVRSRVLQDASVHTIVLDQRHLTRHPQPSVARVGQQHVHASVWDGREPMSCHRVRVLCDAVLPTVPRCADYRRCLQRRQQRNQGRRVALASVHHRHKPCAALRLGGSM